AARPGSPRPEVRPCINGHHGKSNWLSKSISDENQDALVARCRDRDRGGTRVGISKETATALDSASDRTYSLGLQLIARNGAKRRQGGFMRGTGGAVSRAIQLLLLTSCFLPARLAAQ